MNNANADNFSQLLAYESLNITWYWEKCSHTERLRDIWRNMLPTPTRMGRFYYKKYISMYNSLGITHLCIYTVYHTRKGRSVTKMTFDCRHLKAYQTTSHEDDKNRVLLFTTMTPWKAARQTRLALCNGTTGVE